MKKPEYNYFHQITTHGKTRLWDVHTKFSNMKIGCIKWHCGWRKFAFFPEPETLFDEDCLRHIAGVLEAETAKQRSSWRKP